MDIIYALAAGFILLCSYILFRWVKKGRKILIFSTILITIIYVVWRITVVPTEGPAEMAIGILLMAAEIIGILQFVIFTQMFSKKYRLEKIGLEAFKEIPTVDIFICTYNEPLELLRKTILASMDVRYPAGKKRIYVCDDGRREELRKMCREFGVDYLTREDNVGAKAGNLNHALQCTDGELFAVLDADMLPTEGFLERTVGYFSREKVAFVQTPQAYYNQDMYQYNLKREIPNEQDFFMRDVEEARAAHGAVLHVGTNAVFRRTHVIEAGGYPTCSITEDMALGMRLQAEQYETVFVNEVLVLGLSATTYSELLQQRDRWCRGNLQVIRNYNPFRLKGLNRMQKIAYIDGIIYWCSSLQKMIYIIAPLLYFLFHISALHTSLRQLLCFFIPFFLGQILAFKALSTGTRNLFWAHIYEVAMAPHISMSILREVLRLKIHFKVTAKDVTTEKRYFQFKVAAPHIVLILLTLAAWLLGGMRVSAREMSADAFSLNMGWSVYNAIALVICCYVAYQKPIYRRTERIKVLQDIRVQLDVGEKHLEGVLKDISDQGSGILCTCDMLPSKGETGSLKIDGVQLDVKIVRIDESEIGLEFIEPDVEALKEIMKIYMRNIKTHYTIER